MDIWVVCDVYESEYEFSTHLTEKGALLDICEKVLSFMDASHLEQDKDKDKGEDSYWIASLNNLYALSPTEIPKKWLDFDIKNWKELDKEQLWKFYDFIQEFTWEHCDIDFTIQRTSVTA